jgi:peptide deformylase
MKEIVQEGTKVLREMAKPVPEEMFGTPELASIIDDMKKALDPELEGVALAAPQIGVPYRIFIVRRDRTVPTPPMTEQGSTLAQNSQGRTLPAQNDVYINPEIVKTSHRRVLMDEGCLSTRGIYGTTLRHERATLRARNFDGNKLERGGGGLLAQIFQHETDHLNGTLFIDHAEHLVEIQHE